MKQVLAGLVSISILVSSVPLEAGVQTTIPELIQQLSLPGKLGYITDQSPIKEGAPTVVLIQDLHLHYQAQKNIQKILEVYESRNLLGSPIAIEGTEGVHDLSLLAQTPAGKAKEKTVDYFLRKGELSGDEAFAILSGNGKRLIGVEDESLYELNKKLYVETLPERRALRETLKDIQLSFVLLKKRYYNRALKQLDQDTIHFSQNPDAWLEAKRKALEKQHLSSDKKQLVQNLIVADQFVSYSVRLFHQQLTLEEAQYVQNHLGEFVGTIQSLLDTQTLLPSTVGPLNEASLAEHFKAALDFYAVALLRDEPMANNTIALFSKNDGKMGGWESNTIEGTKNKKSFEKKTQLSDVVASNLPNFQSPVILIAGGFHTAGLVKRFKQAGVNYVVITPNISDVSKDYAQMYEDRLSGKSVSASEIEHDFNQTPVRDALADLTLSKIHTLRHLAQVTQLLPAWNEVLEHFTMGSMAGSPVRGFRRTERGHLTLFANGVRRGFRDVPSYENVPLLEHFSFYRKWKYRSVYQEHPDGGDPFLVRVKEVGPVRLLKKATVKESNEENELVEKYLPGLVHAHVLAAVIAKQYSADQGAIGKVGDKVATQMFGVVFNWLKHGIDTAASEGVRDDAATSEGVYGLMSFLGIPHEPELDLAIDAVEGTTRLTQKAYLACVTIASYAFKKLYDKSKKFIKLPDDLYLLSVVGPVGSGVSAVVEDSSKWVESNMLKVAELLSRKRGRKVELKELRITGLLVRDRHYEMINQSLSILGIPETEIRDSGLWEYFETKSVEGEKYIQLKSPQAAKSLEKYVKQAPNSGKLVFKNSFGGSITLASDGDLMPIEEIVNGSADMAMGSGGVAESIMKTRMGYLDIDLSGYLVSGEATKKGGKQAIDPLARVITSQDELEACEKAFMGTELSLIDAPNGNGKYVSTVFNKELLAGGRFNLTVAVTPLGDPLRRVNDYVPEMHEVEISDDGTEIRAQAYIGTPAGARLLMPIIYETPLADLLKKEALLRKAETQRTGMLNLNVSDELANLHLKIAKVYGDLRMFEKAERYFETAKFANANNLDQIEGWRSYYKGLQLLLGQERPDLVNAAKFFHRAIALGVQMGQAGLEMMKIGEIKSLSLFPLADAFDSVVKAATKEEREIKIKVFLDLVTHAEEKDWPFLFQFFNRVMRLSNEEIQQLDKNENLINRILEAALDNSRFSYQTTMIIQKMTAKKSPLKTVIHIQDENPHRLSEGILKNTRKLEGLVNVSMRMGGSTAEIQLVDSQGVTNDPVSAIKISRTEIAQAVDVNNPDSVIEFLMAKTILLLRRNGVSTRNVEKVGVSFAGPIEHETHVTGTNMVAKFESYDLAAGLRRAFDKLNLSDWKPLKEKGIKILNDGFASAIGEYLFGALKNVGGIVLILGTGIGGAAIKSNGEIDASIRELGHILLWDVAKQEYVVMDMDKLSENGWYKEGVFNMPSGYVYFENHLAGPWTAVRFLKSLGDTDSESLLNVLNQNGLNVSKSDWNQIRSFGDEDLLSWGKNLPEAIGLAINRFIITPHKFTSNPELIGIATRFEDEWETSLVKALRVLLTTYPDQKRVVLVSGMIEARKELSSIQEKLSQLNKEFERNKQDVLISEMGGERENAAFAVNSNVSQIWQFNSPLMAMVAAIGVAYLQIKAGIIQFAPLLSVDHINGRGFMLGLGAILLIAGVTWMGGHWRQMRLQLQRANGWAKLLASGLGYRISQIPVSASARLKALLPSGVKGQRFLEALKNSHALTTLAA